MYKIIILITIFVLSNVAFVQAGPFKPDYDYPEEYNPQHNFTDDLIMLFAIIFPFLIIALLYFAIFAIRVIAEAIAEHESIKEAISDIWYHDWLRG